MNCAKILPVVSILLAAATLLSDRGASAQPVAAGGTPTKQAAGPAPSNPASQPSSRSATQPVDEKAVAELIHLLGDNSLKVREEATKKLIGMGPAAYLPIEAKLQEKTLDLESVGRIKAVLSELTPLYSVWPFDANEAARRQDDTGKILGIPKALALDLGNNVSLKLVLIPAGKFLMGSPGDEKGRSDNEGPQHVVTITKPFYMGRTHVTVDQFAAFVKDSGYKTDGEKDGWSSGFEIKDGKLDFKKVNGCSWRNPSFDQKGDHPVVQVSWNDAKAFCDWLAKKSGKTVFLPPEAQWEYACRAGTRTAHPWGTAPDAGKGWANCADQSLKKKIPNAPAVWDFFSWDDGYVFTSPCGSFKANAFGLYDMIGNAWEWCSDWYADSYANADTTDPIGPASGMERATRGGSWFSDPNFCRSAYRFRIAPGIRGSYIGFRVSLALR